MKDDQSGATKMNDKLIPRTSNITGSEREQDVERSDERKYVKHDMKDGTMVSNNRTVLLINVCGIQGPR